MPWKRQTIDESRGPVGSYTAVHRALPDLPDGVAWQQDPTTRDWSLVRVDQQQERNKQQYCLQRAMAWNPHTGREQLVVKPVLKSLVKTTETTVVVNSDDVVQDEDAPPLPVLGRDYVVHTVLPSDTFSGLCLRYKIKPVMLRRINQFSGTNLALAPSKLLIPLGKGVTLDALKLQDTNSSEYKMQLVLAEFPSLTALERKAYLDMNEWDVEKTLQEIRQDTEWEQKQVYTGVPAVIQEDTPKDFHSLELTMETKPLLSSWFCSA